MKKNIKKSFTLVLTLLTIIIFNTKKLSAEEIPEVQILRIEHSLIFLPSLKGDPNNIDGNLEITILVPPLGGNSAQRASLTFYLKERNGTRVPLLVSIPGVEKVGNTLNLREVDPTVGNQIDITLKLTERVIKKLRNRFNKPVKFKLYAELLEPFHQNYFLKNIKVMDIHPKYK